MVNETNLKGNLLFEIDRESYEPAYLQLANILRRQISEGVFRPGDQLPSESQLCRRYAISPMTVRRAINLLADQGVVRHCPGARHLRSRPGTEHGGLRSARAGIALQRISISGGVIRLLDVRVVSADERTARKLDLHMGDSAIYIRRLFLQQGQPIFYHRAYLVYDPTRPIVEAEMDVVSLQGLFTNGSNTLLKHGTLNIEAALMNQDEASLLLKPLPCGGVLPGAPVLRFRKQAAQLGLVHHPQRSLAFLHPDRHQRINNCNTKDCHGRNRSQPNLNAKN